MGGTLAESVRLEPTARRRPEPWGGGECRREVATALLAAVPTLARSVVYHVRPGGTGPDHRGWRTFGALLWPLWDGGLCRCRSFRVAQRGEGEVSQGRSGTAYEGAT